MGQRGRHNAQAVEAVAQEAARKEHGDGARLKESDARRGDEDEWQIIDGWRISEA